MVLCRLLIIAPGVYGIEMRLGNRLELSNPTNEDL